MARVVFSNQEKKNGPYHCDPICLILVRNGENTPDPVPCRQHYYFQMATLCDPKREQFFKIADYKGTLSTKLSRNNMA